MSGEFTYRQRQAIYERDGACLGCGQSRDWTVQHRVARGMGGTRTKMTTTHGIYLCGSGTTGCHGWTEAHPDQARILGWRVDRDIDPATVPVWRHNVAMGHCWAWLTEEPDGTALWGMAWSGEDAVHPEATAEAICVALMGGRLVR